MRAVRYRVMRELFAPGSTDEKVIIQNFARFDEKLKKFPKKFEIVTDFDFTITKYRHMGFSVSSIDMVVPLLSPEQIERKNQLFFKYHPLEMDFSLEKSLRNFYMEEWWTKEHAIVCEVDVKREQLEEIFENSHMILRSRVENVFHMCDDLKIPITVLSGGIGNFVEIALSQIKADLSKIKANFMEFDENGVFKGFSSPKIHSGNKANSVKDFKTDAIVLLGDMPSDANAVPEASTHCISIGFYNDSTLFKLEDFTSKFDIVVLNDGDWKVVERLLEFLKR